jgi:hypothetical protein
VKRIGLVMGLGLGLWACDEPLKSVELVVEPRLLGARVEVAGEPERAAPLAGETATVSLLVASPALEPSLGFALAVCPAEPRSGARSSCAAEPFAQVLSESGDAPVPSLTFDVPDDIDPNGNLLVLGIVCPDGSPVSDGQSCDGPDPGTPVSLEFELARDDDVNLNPTLQPEAIFFDDQDWPEIPAIEGDCAGLGFAEVEVSSRHTFEVDLDAGDRDALLQTDDLDPTRESLQLSHFATAGDLSRAFETIHWHSNELVRTTTWTAPKEPGLVRFWLVLRDFRGGSSFVTRSVCVLPNP